MKALVIVHAGSLYTSGAVQVDPAIVAQVSADLCDAITECDALFVIDGMLSDGVPTQIDLLISARMGAILNQGGMAARVWGCDAGEHPFPSWTPRGPVGDRMLEAMVFDGQDEAAAALASRLEEATQIRVAGAWGTRDMTGGCATGVLQVLKDLLPGRDVAFSDAILYEEDIDETPTPEFD